MALVLGVAACADAPTTPDYPPIVWEGTALEVGSDDPLPDCGSPEPLDEFVLALSAELGVEVETISLFIVADADPYCPGTSPVGGCSPEAGVAVVEDLRDARHELVHAMLGHDSNGSRFAQEGLATYFGDPVEVQGELGLRDTVEAFASADRDDFANWNAYASAGLAVSRMMNEHGRTESMGFLSSLTRDDSLDDVDAALLDAFGSGLDALDASFAESPACDLAALAEPVLGCDAAPALTCFEASTGGGELLIDIDCEQLLAPVDGRARLHATIEVLDAGAYSFVLTSPDDEVTEAHAFFQRCGGGCSTVDGGNPDGSARLEQTAWGVPPPPGELRLDAGTYVVTIDLPAESVGSLRITETRCE